VARIRENAQVTARAATSEPEPAPLYIGGEWCPSSDGKALDIRDPATGKLIDRVAVASTADVERALTAAHESWRDWRRVDAWSRAAILRRVGGLVLERREEIAATMTEEQGKPLAEARAEVGAAAEQFDWYADEARRIYGRVVPSHSASTRIFVAREPVGPVAAFTAWNFPALLPARKIAPALAAGCSIVLKPAEEAPRTALALALACHDAGVPAGIVNVVVGDPAQISAQLLSSEVIRKVTLTGSVPVGQHLLRLAADGVKSVTMELGGHAPVLVLADADIDRAVETCVAAKFRNCGQVCISPTRFYVHESIHDAFVERVVERVRTLAIGPGASPETEVGPLANQRRLTATEELVREAVAQGAAVRTGGRRFETLPDGYFYEPTVLTDATDSMRVMREEPFGPIMPIVRFSSLEDAVSRANSTEYGLAGYLFTRDLSAAHRTAEELEVGMVGINNLLIATAEAPFGGVKRSGFGREGGSEGIEGYTVVKYVNVHL
jgi:succinate-semialdehyde dehydrogenase/glutarate-semialdehyde dehydrogenase